MAAPPEKFSVEEHRAIIKFLFLQGKGAKQIHDEISQNMGDSGPSCATVKRVVDFKTGHFDVESEKPSGRPISVFVPPNMKAIYDMIMEDRQISAKSIAIYLRISRERVGAIIHNDLEMRKLAAKWIPKLLTTEQKMKESSVAVL